MRFDSHELSRGKAVIFKVTSAIGTKLHRQHVGIFVEDHLLINVVTRIGLVSDCMHQRPVLHTNVSRKSRELSPREVIAVAFLLTPAYGFF